MNNSQRIRRAHEALTGYNDEPETDVIDLLADLMHFCASRRRVIDFANCLRIARDHYQTEKQLPREFFKGHYDPKRI